MIETLLFCFCACPTLYCDRNCVGQDIEEGRDEKRGVERRKII
jgi:hypothetical protein